VKDTILNDVGSVVALLRKREAGVHLNGFKIADRNDESRFILVTNSNLFYSIDTNDVIEELLRPDGTSQLWLNSGALVWRTEIATIDSLVDLTTGLDSEDSNILSLLRSKKSPYQQLVNNIIAFIYKRDQMIVTLDTKLGEYGMWIPNEIRMQQILAQIVTEPFITKKFSPSMKDVHKIYPKGTVRDMVNLFASRQGIKVPKID
jgi:hypothetical protein